MLFIYEMCDGIRSVGLKVSSLGADSIRSGWGLGSYEQGVFWEQVCESGRQFVSDGHRSVMRLFRSNSSESASSLQSISNSSAADDHLRPRLPMNTIWAPNENTNPPHIAPSEANHAGDCSHLTSFLLFFSVTQLFDGQIPSSPRLIVKMFGQTIANGMANQPSSSDYQLQLYVDQVMKRYDTNRNGILEPDQIAMFFNELFAQWGIPKRINQWEATNFMRKVDTNFDGKANKYELFRAFKAMMASSGGYNTGYGSSYESQWSPNFSGYVPAPTAAYGYGNMGNMGMMGGYGGYQSIGYTTPVVYGGGYRMW